MDLLTSGIQLADAFCQLNNVPRPDVHVYERSAWALGDRTCAYYRPDEGISISPGHCGRLGTAGRAWSWPGYTTDRTPFGVVQHELGHHLDWLLSGRRPRTWRGSWCRELVAAGEHPITSYAPDASEFAAEMLRVFITNPDLLAQVRPRTYERILAKLVPATTATWRQVLEHFGAPARHLRAAERKIPRR